MNASIIRSAAELIMELGFSISANVEDGTRFVSSDDIVAMCENYDAWAAKDAGVSLDTYLAYCAWLDKYAGGCTTTTRRGKTCGRYTEVCRSPRDFRPGWTDKCAQHQQMALRHRQTENFISRRAVDTVLRDT